MSNLAMNDTADDTPVVLTPADAVRAAQERLDSAIQAVKRARGVRDGAQVRVAELQALEADAVQRDTETLRAWTIAGNWHEAPAPTSDPQHLQDVASAAHRLRTANANLALFEKAEVAAREQLGAADRAWRASQAARRREESDRIAERIIELRREEFDLCARLAVAQHDSAQTSRELLSHRALVTLSNPPARPRSETFESVNGKALGGIVADINTAICGHVSLLDGAREFWDEFSAGGM
ncbi:MAG: hypothetical protein JWL65_5382 [Gammaproteobacteria bacterium]|nr:hypothetical protein [Gammaproteobacteria bacterium]